MKINVIGVPLNLGCDREGVERAPNHLRERGLMRIIRKNGHRAFDLGNLYVPLVSEADKFARGRSLKYLDAIVEVNNNLRHVARRGFPFGDRRRSFVRVGQCVRGGKEL